MIPIPQPVARRLEVEVIHINSPQALEMLSRTVHAGPGASWRASHAVGQRKGDGD